MIYGAGKSVYKAFTDFSICVEDYLLCKENEMLYFGDLDYEGISIYEGLYNKYLCNQVKEQIVMKPFCEAYEKMIIKVKKLVDNIEELPITKEGQNILPKQKWKEYGLETFAEQTNVVFSVLLFIMEQSLRDEICTVDDIGNFIDHINMKYMKKNLSYEKCLELAVFIVNDILCDEGRAMYFEGFDYENGTKKEINISFIANKIVYKEHEVRRTSYYLTDDGYNLMLSTLEIENNMKLTIHEMIFHLHLEKANYDKAVDDIKNIFNLLRIQLKKIEEAMRKIRQNALQFSVTDYKEILEENLQTIDETKKKFLLYREHVADLVKQLEALSNVSLIKRFHIENDFFSKIYELQESYQNLDIFLRPLFNRNRDKIYNVEKATAFQTPVKEKDPDDTEEIMDFDNEEWQKEQEQKILIPDVQIFKEIMIELLKNGIFDIHVLQKERAEHFSEQAREFQINYCLLEIMDEELEFKNMVQLKVFRKEPAGVVEFFNRKDETGCQKKIRCSNVVFWISEEETWDMN